MERSEFETFYLAAMPGMYRIARSILHQDADIQDALQEAAMRAWAHCSAIRPESGKAYLMRILINECRNIQRRRRRAVPVETMPEAAEAPDLDAHADLADALAQLPHKLCLPLLLKYMEGYTEQEIAHTLRITLAAVKSRLRRGRQALQDLMKEVDFE